MTIKPITKPPGSTIIQIADFLYSRKTRERVFDPLIADMRDEIFAGWSQGRFRKAQWIRFKYTMAFVTLAISDFSSGENSVVRNLSSYANGQLLPFMP